MDTFILLDFNTMKIPNKAIKVDSFFPIRLWKARGKVYLADLQENIYIVYCF